MVDKVFRMADNYQLVARKRPWAAAVTGVEEDGESVSLLKMKTSTLDENVQVFEEKRIPWNLYTTVCCMPRPKLDDFKLGVVSISEHGGSDTQETQNTYTMRTTMVAA